MDDPTSRSGPSSDVYTTQWTVYTMYIVWNVHGEQCMECTQCTVYTFCCGGISAVVTRFSLWIFYLTATSPNTQSEVVCEAKMSLRVGKRERGGLCFAGPWPTSRAPLCCMIAHCCGWIAHTQMKMMLMQSFPLETLEWRAKEIYEVFSHRCKSCNNHISCFWILSIPLHSHGSGWNAKNRKILFLKYWDVVSDVILLVWAGYAAEVSLHASSKWFLRGNLPNVF